HAPAIGIRERRERAIDVRAAARGGLSHPRAGSLPLGGEDLRADRFLRLLARDGADGLGEGPHVSLEVERAIRARAVELILRLLDDDRARSPGLLAVLVDVPLDVDVDRLSVGAVRRAGA